MTLKEIRIQNIETAVQALEKQIDKLIAEGEHEDAIHISYARAILVNSIKVEQEA